MVKHSPKSNTGIVIGRFLGERLLGCELDSTAFIGQNATNEGQARAFLEG